MNTVPVSFTFATVFIFGLLFGSFLNAVIHRVPLGVDIFRRSFCPQCGKQIRWYHNVPVVSWLVLRGRCRDCAEPIPVRYPLVELAGGLFAVMAVAKWGLSLSALSMTMFCYLMLVLALIDVDHRILPNVINLPFTVVGIALSFFDPRIYWLDSVLGAVLGGGLLYGTAWLYLKARGKEGMGMGDVKMMLLVGAFLGVFFIPLFFVIVQKWFGRHGREYRQNARNTGTKSGNGVQRT